MLIRKLVTRNLFAVQRKMFSSQSSSNPEDDAIFTEHGNRALIELNRPKQLNALNLSMIKKIHPKLKAWDTTKELIVVKGNGGKAFCAGGDVVAITKDKSGGPGREYFRAEYLTNAQIASLKVPYLAIIHGIVMGGGVGLSIHGKYRLATETSLFAMPETQIGLFPDVGASYFLSRMPDNMGMFLALTGYRLKGYDLCHTGIATHFCNSALLPEVETELFQPDSDVECVLNKFHSTSIEKSNNPPFSLSKNVDVISKCFSACSLEEIFESLRQCDNDFAREMIKLMNAMSPISLKVTFRQIREAANMSVYDVLNMDYRLGWNKLGAKDFYEGVRALLVDKDKNPKWQHKSIDEITDAEVASYFQPLEKSQELNLPSSLLKDSAL